MRASAPAAPNSSEHNAVVTKYCATCHNERRPAAGLSLASFDVSKAAEHPEIAEKMIVKLQAGMMPPRAAQRPAPAVQAALIAALETTLDTAAAKAPNPGRRTFQRLNRPEYERAIREMLGVEVNAGDWLPLDTKSANFDNIADAQALSPTLLESYLNAATAISRIAVGDRTAPTIDTTYTNPSYMSQHPWDYVEGAPYGTRGGMVVEHAFPADAEYEIQMTFNAGENARFEDIDISVDGERVALLNYELASVAAADGRGQAPVRTEPIFIRAGQHQVSAAFVRRTEGPYEDLIKPHGWSFAGGGSGGSGITTLPHLRDLIVVGPFRATGVSETPSRQRIFSCRPTTAADEAPCARQILTRLGAQAYRRPMTAAEIDRLMPFYERAAAKDGFEAGITASLEAILASPYFIFRIEREREARPGSTVRVADIDLASRLSFFLWGTPPDKELLSLATSGRLSEPRVLEAAGQAHARRRAERRARHAVRRAVAAAAGRGQGPSRSELLPELRREPGRGDAPRDGAVLQQPGAGRPQLPRPLSRRLHVRERTAGAALRHPRRRGDRVPEGPVPGRHPPRPARTGQHAGADVSGQPHFAGAARQVGAGSAGGGTAAGAAAEHSRAGRYTPGRRTAGC